MKKKVLKSTLQKVVSNLLAKGWSEKKVKAYLLKKVTKKKASLSALEGVDPDSFLGKYSSDLWGVTYNFKLDCRSKLREAYQKLDNQEFTQLKDTIVSEIDQVHIL